MKKNTFYTVALLFAGAILTACSGGDDMTSDITPDPQPSVEADVVELSGSLEINGSTTRTIEENGYGTWEVGDQFAIYYLKANGAHATAIATVNSVTYIDYSYYANFTATLYSPESGYTRVKLVYPASAHDGQGGFKTDAFMTQDGTVDCVNRKGLDIQSLEANMRVEGTNAAIYTRLDQPARMEPEVCLYRLVLKNSNNNNINATKLEISDGTHNYTIKPAAATSNFFIAMLPIENANFTFKASSTDEGTIYTKQNVTLSTCTSANVGHVILEDGNIYEFGYGSGITYNASYNNKTLYKGRRYSQDLKFPAISPVAMIAYVKGDNEGSVETGTSYRGLAIAMNDVMSTYNPLTCAWCSKQSADCTSNDEDNVTDATVACNTKNGISMTASLVSHSDGSTHNHYAANAAHSYNKQRPDGTSEWFLPSVGQWQLITWGLVSKATGTSYTTPITTVLSDENEIVSKINSVLNSAGAASFYDCHWLSTECSDDNAWSIAANGYAFKHDKMYSGSRIRPVIAF